MPQPRDDAPGWDPYKTDPLHVQLITEEEVIRPSNRIDDQGEDSEEYGYQSSKYPTLERRPEGPFRKRAKPLSDLSHPENSMKDAEKADPNLAIRILEFLAPLNDPWRLCIGFAVFFLLLNTVASRGWLTVIGLSPFASAESVTELRIEQLDEKIENAVKAHCLAPTGEAKFYYYDKLKTLKAKYRKASTERVEIPTCKDLGVEWVDVVPREP